MEKKIPYISRNYDDYKSALIELSKTYYPELSLNFNDASVGSWIIDLNAAIADELSYHIDRVFQETNINSAKKVSSIYTMARNAGFKIPGPKGAMCEVAFTCVLPPDGSGSTKREPNWTYAPIIKRGPKVSSGGQTFELMEELDFKKQFNEDGASNRLIQPNRDSNKVIVSYTITKYAVVIAGETNIYKKYVSASDIKPFMKYFNELVATEVYNDVLFVSERDENVWWYDGERIQFRTPNYSKILSAMQTQPTLTLADMKEVTGISIAAIQKLLDQLLAKKYVERGDKDGSWRVYVTQ